MVEKNTTPEAPLVAVETLREVPVPNPDLIAVNIEQLAQLVGLAMRRASLVQRRRIWNAVRHLDWEIGKQPFIDPHDTERRQ